MPMEMRLQLQSNWYEMLVNASSDAITILQGAGRVFVNPAFVSLYGLSSKEEALALPRGSCILPEDRARLQASHPWPDGSPILQTLSEYRIVRPDGSLRHIEASEVPVTYNGEPAMMGILRDVTDRRQLLATLQEAESIYRTLVQNAGDAIALTVAGQRVFVNQAFLDIHGLEHEHEVIGVAVNHFVVPEDRERVHVYAMARQNHQDVRSVIEYRVRRPNGDIRVVEATAHPVTYRGQAALLGVLRDITDRKLREDELAHWALDDALTGLCNRRSFCQRVEARLQAGLMPLGALLFIDLDKFKTINDTLGHAAGDDVLRAVARRLRMAVREEDIVARMGGDEFAIFLPAVDMTHALFASQRVQQAIERSTVQVAGIHQITVRASVGVTVVTSAAATLEDILGSADRAMYTAKAEGAKRLQVVS